MSRSKYEIHILTLSANQIALYKGREIKRKKWCFLFYERKNIWGYAR